MLRGKTSSGAGSVRPRAFVAPLGVWVLMALCAVLNGVFRELVLVSRMGDAVGHVVSTFLLLAVILAISWLYFANAAIDYSRAELVLVGVVWTVLTVGFEFLVGYVEGVSIEVTLAQYDVFAGRIWVLVPLTLLLAPLLFGRVLTVRRR